MLKREAAIEIWLELHRATTDIPRPILILSAKQILRATAEHRMRDRDAAGLVQRVEHLTRRIRVAKEIGTLRPPAVGSLRLNQCLRHFAWRFGISPTQSEHLHNALFSMLRDDAHEPIAGPRDASVDLRFSTRCTIGTQ